MRILIPIWAILSMAVILGVILVGNAFGLTPHQKKVVKTTIKTANSLNASYKVKIAALATIKVESNAKNLTYGDRDSAGAYQQRPSMGWGTFEQVTNVRYATKQFVLRAKAADRGQPAGTLAQDVQRSAFPDRYAMQKGWAKRQLRTYQPKVLKARASKKKVKAKIRKPKAVRHLDNKVPDHHVTASEISTLKEYGLSVASLLG